MDIYVLRGMLTKRIYKNDVANRETRWTKLCLRIRILDGYATRVETMTRLFIR